jgi:hypothetical protein
MFSLPLILSYKLLFEKKTYNSYALKNYLADDYDTPDLSMVIEM